VRAAKRKPESKRGDFMAARVENLVLDPKKDPKKEHLHLVSLTLRACEIARTAVAHAADGIASNAPSLFQAVDECEKELDALDRELDERLTHALGAGSDSERRELLCCHEVHDRPRTHRGPGLHFRLRRPRPRPQA